MPRSLGFCSALLTALAFGCSSEAPRGIVKGRVIHKGQPVTGCMIHFESREAGVEAQVALSADGHYEVKTLRGDGLPPGTYKVSVTPGRIMEPGEEVPLASQGPKTKPLPSTTVPTKYHRGATTDLTVDVKAGDNPPFDFDLKP